MQFLASPQARDLRKVFQYFAKADGGGDVGYKPSRRNPTRDGNKWNIKPKDKDKLPAIFFTEKLTQTLGGREVGEREAAGLTSTHSCQRCQCRGAASRN